MTKKISIFVFCGAVLALVLWVFCGPDVAAEAVYPVENGANWFSRNVVRRFKAVFASGAAFIENDRLRAEVANLKMACADADRVAAENARLSIYEGNYDFYAAERRVRREAELRKFEKQQKEVARQEEMRYIKEKITATAASMSTSEEPVRASLMPMESSLSQNSAAVLK